MRECVSVSRFPFSSVRIGMCASPPPPSVSAAPSQRLAVIASRLVGGARDLEPSLAALAAGPTRDVRRNERPVRTALEERGDDLAHPRVAAQRAAPRHRRRDRAGRAARKHLRGRMEKGEVGE